MCQLRLFPANRFAVEYFSTSIIKNNLVSSTLTIVYLLEVFSYKPKEKTLHAVNVF